MTQPTDRRLLTEAAVGNAGVLKTALDAKVNVADAVSLAGAGNLPLGPGTAFQGSANVAARADHVHPKQPSLANGVPVSGDFHPGRITGTAWTPTVGRTYAQAHPVFPMNGQALTVTQLVTYVQTAGSADSAVKVALFGSRSDGLPDFTNPIIPSTTITTAATTGRVGQALGSNVTLPVGWYWKAFIVTGTTSPAFKSTSEVTKVWLRNPSVVDQYSATRQITTIRTELPTTNTDNLDYEGVNDIAPLVLVVT